MKNDLISANELTENPTISKSSAPSGFRSVYQKFFKMNLTIGSGLKIIMFNSTYKI